MSGHAAARRARGRARRRARPGRRLRRGASARRRARHRPQRHRRLRRRRGDPVGARARHHARAREQGEPRRGRRARARRAPSRRRAAAAGRQRALRDLPVPRGPGSRRRSSRSSSPPRAARSAAARARSSSTSRSTDALAHPTWSMGRKITVDSATLANKGLELIEAHWLFGIPYDRIEVVVHPTSVVHSLVRFRDGALLAHLGRPDMRVPISFALTYPERAAVPAEPLDLAAGLDLHFEAPDAASFPLLPLARGGGGARRHVPVRVQRRERGRGGRVPRRADQLPGDRRHGRGRARAGRRRSGARPRRSRRCRRGEPPRGRTAARTGMTIFISIVGLGLLVFVHELGHFTASVALRMRPRKFYIGFPPALVKRTRNGIEYGIGMIPLGGFVKIPGMHRPGVGRRRPRLRPRDRGGAGARRRGRPAAPLARLGRPRCGPGIARRVRRRSPAQQPALGAGARGRRQGRHRHRRCARPGRVLARPHVEARARDLRRAGREHHLRVRPLHRALHDLRAARRRRPSTASASKTAAAALGLQSGDKIVSINGAPMSREARSPTRSARRRGSRSRSSSSGTGTQVDARAARGDEDRRDLSPRLHPQGSGPARRRPRRRESGRVTGVVSKGIVTSLGNLVTG